MALMIHNVPIDNPARPFVIAELSGNHGQKYQQAERLVAAAAAAGADPVKVQTFTPEELCADVPILFGHNAEHDAWCARLGVTRMRDLFTKGGCPRDWHLPLKRFAESCGVTFLSTPFSVDAAKFLVEEVGVPALKIASGDLTFTPLLQYASTCTKLPLLVSTGGATMDECREAVQYPLRAAVIQGRVVFLHCCSIYPCPDDEINLRAIETMREYFGEGLPIGFSDHTLSCEVVPAMVATVGCCVYEKHIRLDDDVTSVDVGHSLTPGQFAKMVEVLRRAPAILGHGQKVPRDGEKHDRVFARRDPSDWLRPTARGREGAWE